MIKPLKCEQTEMSWGQQKWAYLITTYRERVCKKLLGGQSSTGKKAENGRVCSETLYR